MAIGYACIHLGDFETKLSTIQLKYYAEEKLIEIINKNLDAFQSILKYNIENNIKLFRLSSDIIPLASHPINTLSWWEIFQDKFEKLSSLIHENNIRITMHPGQYTLINSPKEDVVRKSILDLEYHNKLLKCLNCDNTSKLVLHIGGVYSDKESAMERFIFNFNKLDNEIKNRLIIENDDKSYTIDDVLYISSKINIPVVFDNLHHKLNHSSNNSSNEFELINKCNQTWKISDGKQKIHYSQSANNYKNGAHSKTINSKEFLSFYNNLINKDIDIMLEVKDKNLSAIKCNLLTTEEKQIKYLEREWAKYKYYVLSNSQSNYNKIRNLLKDKKSYEVIKFYEIIENTMQIELSKNSQINSIDHIWGYFKSFADEKERNKYITLITAYKNNKKSLSAVKNYLYKLAYNYNVEYLLNSLYFYI
ncbi:MAG: UV DNA damage repair endonuclease UvsE [Pleomorphochaeta sp.]